MKLVAALIVGENEAGRYLKPCIAHLLEFCDEIVLLFDGEGRWSWDLVNTWGDEGARVIAVTERSVAFFEHEGRARQLLLDETLARRPSHVLAVDCDELVSDGQAIRAACLLDRGNGAWTLQMDEVWAADDRYLWTRQDGGWRTHPVPILYRVPDRLDARWRIQERALACGREPLAVRQLAAKATPTGASCLHFGWANRAERQARYERYAAADGGKFHASSHLQSILAPDRRVRLARREWPSPLAPYKVELLERANREPVSV